MPEYPKYKTTSKSFLQYANSERTQRKTKSEATVRQRTTSPNNNSVRSQRSVRRKKKPETTVRQRKTTQGKAAVADASNYEASHRSVMKVNHSQFPHYIANIQTLSVLGPVEDDKTLREALSVIPIPNAEDDKTWNELSHFTGYGKEFSRRLLEKRDIKCTFPPGSPVYFLLGDSLNFGIFKFDYAKL